jgi:hypothetical protein
MNVEAGIQNIIILFWKQQFHFWEYINRNQTFILDSHRPFIFSVVKTLSGRRNVDLRKDPLYYSSSLIRSH